MLKTQMFIAAALFTGVAIGYFVKSDASASAPAETRRPAKTVIADEGSDATVAALRARVAELEKRLRASAAETAPARTAEVAAVAQPARPRPQESWRDRIEQMKKNDPARYAQMTNRFAQFRRRRLEHAQSRIDFLSSVDTSRMSASARKTHEALQDMIEKREELEQRMHNMLDLSDEERRNLWDEVRRTDREMNELNRQARDNLLEQTAGDLGFEGDDAKTIRETINGIIEATEGMGWGNRGGRRRR